MKRLVWIVAMVSVAVVALAVRPTVASSQSGGSCGQHCVTSGFCDASCWTCGAGVFGNVCK